MLRGHRDTSIQVNSLCGHIPHPLSVLGVGQVPWATRSCVVDRLPSLQSPGQRAPMRRAPQHTGLGVAPQATHRWVHGGRRHPWPVAGAWSLCFFFPPLCWLTWASDVLAKPCVPPCKAASHGGSEAPGGSRSPSVNLGPTFFLMPLQKQLYSSRDSEILQVTVP